MGLFETRCTTCGKKMAIVYHNGSLETLLIDRMCDCPSAKMAKVASDGSAMDARYRSR